MNIVNRVRRSPRALRSELSQSFPLDDDALDRAHFLQTTGFLHVRNVFDAAEIEELRAEVRASRNPRPR